MATEIRVPTLGESITEATVGKWFKKAGNSVSADEPLVELETDKVTLEVNAPSAGVLSEIAAETGQTVAIGALLGQLVVAERRRPACASAAKSAPAPPRNFDAASAGRGQDRRRGQDRSRVDRRQRQARPGAEGRRARGHRRGSRASAGPSARAGSSAGACANSGPRSGSRARGAHDHCRRQRPRRAGAHDQAASDHRAPPQGRAKHRGDAHDLQRGRHERSDGVARPLQGRVREKARSKARLHGLLRQSVRSGAEGNPRRQRRNRRRRPCLQELLPYRHRRRHRQGAHRAGGARRGQAVASPRSRRRSPRSASAPATASSRSRNCRAEPSPSPTAASTAR